MNLIPKAAAIILLLGLIEATAYWWMHPSRENTTSPVLTHVATLTNGDAAFPKITPLRDLYTQSAPMLRCTGGKVWHVQQNETVGLHLAFFEWDGTDTGSVLEAFRHAPEACMGSIGMKLISREEPITYIVGAQEEPTQTTEDSLTFDLRPSSFDLQSPTDHSPSIDSSSTDHRSLITSHSGNTTLVFEHTIFQDQGTNANFPGLSPKVHAFRAVWVAGREGASYRERVDGDTLDQLTTIRLKSTLSRYRPTNARVIQGAVRGATNSQAAWQAFEESLLEKLVILSSGS